MKNKIKILSNKVINQIAAGEVIDRPASVLRELLENSLDANANKIQVDFIDGGKKSIYVIDNGSGMNKEDLLLAFKRHATSKISLDSDLNNITSLGFRGEALPSIASVSKVQARSSVDGLTAYEVKLKNSEFVSMEEIAALKGTSIYIKDLFYNVPVRRKFLKSVESEKRQLVSLIRRYMISFPSVEFKLTNDSKEIYNLRSSSIEGRLKDIYGKPFLENLIKVDINKNHYKVAGYIGNLTTLKKRSGEQYIFINNRHINNRIIFSSIMSGYKTIISRREYPFICLFVAMPRDEYDVNVHPMKSEVRFTNEWKMHHLIKTTIEDALSDIIKTIPQFDKSNIYNYQMETTSKLPFSEESVINTENGNSNKQFHQSIIERATDRISDFPGESHNGNLNSQSIWQIHNKYLITEINDGLVIIDQHVAHERVLYETAKKCLEGDGLSKQTLLFPQTITFQPDEYSKIIDIFPYLSKLGFDIREFAKDTIIIEGIPSDVSYGNEKHVINDILEHYMQYNIIDSNFIDHMAATFACKAAVKAGDSLTFEERRDLIDKLFSTDHPYYCPHGRPIIINLSIDELDKRFERK